MRVYDQDWQEVGDLFKDIDLCAYPTVCGNYGICTNGQCSCLGSKNGTNYFQQIKDRQPDRGCSPVVPLSCEASKTHILLELQNITYFPQLDISIPGINLTTKI